MSGWRKAMLGMAVAVGMIGALVRRKSHEARVEPAVKRRAAAAADVVRGRLAADAFAQSASLWLRGAMGPCLVSARYADHPVSAQFSAVMAMDGPMTITRAAYQPLRLPGMGEAGRVSKIVKIQPGAAPVVRLVRGASFKPKRALYGAVELKAAA